MIGIADSWPRELHDECTARRLAEGHQPGYAELHGALDVLRLARVTYPRFSIEDALGRLCRDHIPPAKRSTPTGTPCPTGATVRSLDEHRRRRDRRA